MKMESRFLDYTRRSCSHYFQYWTDCIHPLAYTGMLLSHSTESHAHHKRRFRNRTILRIQQYHSHIAQCSQSVPLPSSYCRPG